MSDRAPIVRTCTVWHSFKLGIKCPGLILSVILDISMIIILASNSCLIFLQRE
jgi:hypothetical protein